MSDLVPARLYVALAAVMGMLAACGDDENGNEDTLLTGFSGLVILIIVIWVIARVIKKRG